MHYEHQAQSHHDVAALLQHWPVLMLVLGKDSAHRRIRGGFRFHTVFALLRHL